MRLLILKCR